MQVELQKNQIGALVAIMNKSVFKGNEAEEVLKLKKVLEDAYIACEAEASPEETNKES